MLYLVKRKKNIGLGGVLLKNCKEALWNRDTHPQEFDSNGLVIILSNSCPNPYKSIEQGTIGLVTRFGRFYKTVDPGLIRLNPYTETVQKVDMRVQISRISDQVIMTKDNVR